MILIVGASGKLGSAVARRLLARPFHPGLSQVMHSAIIDDE